MAGQASWGLQSPEISTNILLTRDYVHFSGERVTVFTVLSWNRVTLKRLRTVGWIMHESDVYLLSATI